MDASVRPLSKDDQELVKLARLFEAMVETEAWKRYIDLVSKKSGEFMANILKEGTTRDEDMGNKGALKALEFCLRLPHAIIHDAGDVLSRARRTSEESDE